MSEEFKDEMTDEEQEQARDKQGKEKSGDGSNSASDDKSGKPTEAEAKLLREVMKLKDKNREFKDQAESVKSELDQIRGVTGNLTVDDLKELIASRKAKEEEDLKKKGDFERLTERMKEENQAALNAANATAEALKAQLQAAAQKIDDLTIGSTFAMSEFVKTESTLSASIARTTFGQHFDYENGKLVAYDKPRGAESRTPLVDASGTPKSFDAALEELYSKHPDSGTLFKSKRRAGADSKGDQSGSAKADMPGVTGVTRISSILSKQGAASKK